MDMRRWWHVHYTICHQFLEGLCDAFTKQPSKLEDALLPAPGGPSYMHLRVPDKEQPSQTHVHPGQPLPSTRRRGRRGGPHRKEGRVDRVTAASH